ncbi:MAG: hypothetical protein RJA09_1372 [Pseudomonadota bacterium]
MAVQTISFWALGWRSLWRDWRAGELRVLVLAIALAVAALTAIGFFADRLQTGLARDARALIGGDAVLRSDHLPPPLFAAEAQRLGLATTLNLSFPTMGRADDANGGAARLVALKAVAPGYPLRGQLRVAPTPDSPDQATRDIPAPGTAWVDTALLVALDLKVGQPLWLGDAQLRIDRVLVVEPDRGAGFMSFAPRVLVNEQDLPATGLVQPASRLSYRLAVAGPDAQVARYVAWLDTALKGEEGRGMRLDSLEGGRPEMQETLARAEKFLNLVALLAALLSAVAVAIASRVYAARHLDDCAMLRVLGVSQGTMARAYTLAFSLVGLAAGVLGVALGYAVHFGFVWLLAELVKTAMPAATWWPAVFGLGVGLTLMLAFGLPPVLQLAKVPPLRVIRRDVGGLKPASLVAVGLGTLGFAALLFVSSRDWVLGAIAVGGFAVAVLVFAVASYLAIRLLRRLVNENTAPRWLRLATRQLTARPAYAVVQVSALSVGLLALVLLVLLRTDLISSWQRATPVDAPNRFVINIQPDQAEPFQATLREQGVQRYDWYPMVRGRLVAVNDRPVQPQDYADDRSQRLVEREFNLSYAASAPGHNRVVAGRWVDNEAGGISVEEGMANNLGLKLGDRLTFDIAGVPVSASISSVRQVDWSSMRVNFCAMFTQGAMPDLPQTYISAYKAPAVPGFDNALVKAYPNITNVDMTATLDQVQRVLGQVIRAVEFLFGFTLAAGLVVLFAAITATRGEREREFAILRAVGAQSALLRQVQRAELAGVGVLAGVLASVMATAVGWALARFVFVFDWTPSVWVPVGGAVAGAALALAAGWWGLRAVLRTPVVATLRQAAQ